MRIFVTGATGWIGSAVTGELLAAGHDVVGLARSDASAEALAARGATPLRGTLDDLGIIKDAAADSDGVVHLGFVHDFDRFAESGRVERSVVGTIGDTLAGSDRPFLFAAGVAGLAPGRLATEDDASQHVGPDAPRGGSEALGLEYAEQGVRTVSLRFAASVHGIGDHGFVAELTRVARERGAAAYVGDGANRWPAVHRSDAARLVALALEQAPAGGVVHAVAEEGVAMLDIAEAIGRSLDVPARSVAPEEAAEHFGWISRFVALDAPASSALTRARYGWTPTGPTLLEDIAAGGYLPRA
ncbi:SDR family oxidoreductase [Luteimicrobium sp. NPDC057192]|uniref:SDR family oxidoreductase n=1 Tax=Luteimicrobium sp. NPDC057192 TaxID=3346042 RepID=UPI003640D9D9